MMDWTNIIVTLITSGAFTAIYFLGDRKTSQVLDNVSKTIDQWKGIADEMKAETLDVRNEMKQMKADYAQKIQAKDNKIDSLYKEQGVWRDRCDKLGSKIAYYRAFECRKSKCPDREPPFGSGVFVDEARCGKCAQNAEN